MGDGNGYEIALETMMDFNNRTSHEACKIMLISFKYNKDRIFSRFNYRTWLFPEQLTNG